MSRTALAIALIAGLSFTVAGPALQLTPAGNYIGGPSGSVGMSTDGTLWTVRPGSQGAFADPGRTFNNSTKVESFAPVRMHDTRPGAPASAQAGILNPGVINSGGFITQGSTLNLSLDKLLVFGFTVFLNITIIPSGHEGFMSLFPTGAAQPNSSNITFSGSERFIANFAAVSVGESANPAATNAISVFCQFPCIVILDVSAAVVNFSSDVLDGLGNPRTLQAAAAKPTRVRPAHLTPNGL